MTEVSDGINQLFTAGLTREAFIEKYRQMQQAAQAGDDESIFTRDVSDTMLNAMYDSFHHSEGVQNNETVQDVTTENDVQSLAGFDGDDESISEEDLVMLYEKTLEKFQNAKVSYDDVIDESSGENLLYPDEMIDLLSIQRSVKIKLANIEKVKIQSEIDELVANCKGITTELKSEYESAKQNRDTAEQTLQKKQQELDLIKSSQESLKESIERKHGEIEGTQDEDTKEELKQEMSDLTKSSQVYDDKISLISSEISGLKSTVMVADTRMKSITSKITSTDKKTDRKIKSKQEKIENVEKRLEEELKIIDSRIEEINQRKLETIKNAGYEGAQYTANLPTFNPNAVDFSALEAKGLKYSESKGLKLAQDIMGHASGFSGKCSKYVRQALQRTGLYNGHTAHAYQMADVLAKNKDFQEISADNIDMNSLPAGCVLVYERGARRNNGKTYSKTSGHIEVTLGDGTACSDGRTRNISSRDVRIFVPVDKS